MHNLRAAHRYATSLLVLAEEQGVVDAIASDMDSLAKTARGSRELQVVFANPVIKSPVKLAILMRLFEGSFQALSLAFFKLVVSKHREVELIGMAESYLDMYRQKAGIVEASVTTAMPLTDELRGQFQEVVAKMTGKKVVLKESTDAAIIGGYKLAIGDRQIDETLAGKLAAIKLQLVDQSYIPQI